MDRDKIPAETKRIVLFAARHHCSVCCIALPLEFAHIIPWCKTHNDHPDNLIALCANCHTRADKEKWGAKYLKKYKKEPCILSKNSQSGQMIEAAIKEHVEIIIDEKVEPLKQRLAELESMIAAYTGAPLSEVKVLSVQPTNSSRIIVSLPKEAAEKLRKGFQGDKSTILTDNINNQNISVRDPLLSAFFDDLKILNVRTVPSVRNPTDTSEKGLETIIFDSLVNESGYKAGTATDYNREYAIDLPKLLEFLRETQPEVIEAFHLEADNPERTAFLARLRSEIQNRGVVEVLRKGISHRSNPHISLFYGTPTPGNDRAALLYAKNIFSITRQLRYSRNETQRALDLGIFINGLPVATFELKNSLTKQTYADAIEQYKNDRDERELLFKFGRCLVHFAVDDTQVWMCTDLKGKKSWFLPFNKGYNDGAGNPPNPNGLMTDYLWKEILTPARLTDIIENYAQIIQLEDEEGRKKYVQVFPRYHQLDTVRQLLADAKANGAGKRYLIQHSPGSGKSNSIAWLAHQLVELKKDGAPVFDSIIVITDRRILDKQIRENITSFAQVDKVVGAATRARLLKQFIESGKKVIVSTIQKFPVILKEIGDEHRDRRFAIIIDEAHSSQGGETMKKMHATLAEFIKNEDETYEDIINRIIESRKLLPNASYFAFTATPKNKTLEMFGEPYLDWDGTIKHRSPYSYTMKQAIEEGFIIDVLKNYTPVQSYYHLIKTVEDNPAFDTKKAHKKLRRYIELHEHAIRQKAEIMIDHFNEEVIRRRKIGGQARAMVVTSSIKQAIEYKHAFDAYLQESGSAYQAIVAFSGEVEVGGVKMDEADFNGFSSAEIPKKFRKDPYRFLIVAEKFQTGYDEPLLHTMYVDKILAGVKAVQTLSRLNRAHPLKHDAFVLDFANKTEVIQEAFQDYYRTTILSETTDPNKLHNLKADLDATQIYTPQIVEELVELYLKGADREHLDPILDACVIRYKEMLDLDGQIKFKGDAKAFLRTYSFLGTILTFTNPNWEKLSIFLNFLVSKLPAPQEEDLSKGILEMIDMDSYRVEARAQVSIAMADAEGEIAPAPVEGGGIQNEPTVDYLSNIIREFNDHFGNIEWQDAEKIRRVITEEIPARVAENQAYQNAKLDSKEKARVEHDRALEKVILGMLTDHTELFKQFADNPDFRSWLSNRIFAITYNKDKS